ncbi:MAG: NFACT family protein [Spirochaetaceae bacterium]|nr:MAG: NFACT family protein [Spirochaetaceae bacterium]
MSLNWREIDAILEEIPFENALIRDIYQPSHPQLVLDLYKPGRPFRVLFSFANPACRLHLLSPTRKPTNPDKTQRFVSFLRARIRGGRIVSAAQIDMERIVRIEVIKADRTVLLWCRLWAAAANLIVTDHTGTILDALYRRPKRGEVSGGNYSVDREIASTSSPESKQQFSIREFSGSGSYNERVESYYFDLEEHSERIRLKNSLLTRLRREENRLLASIRNLEQMKNQYQYFENYRRWGDLILANIHTLKRGDRWLTAADSDDPNKTWDIELDPRATPAQNADSYYRRYRKAKAGVRSIEEERRQQQRQLDRLQERIQALESDGEALESLRQELQGRKRKQHQEKQGLPPGLSFTSGQFSILVGRNARENDALLRHFVRGNDTWLHARDYPGGYVFIRSIPGKSIPLETLLDAASLALLYSKGRDSAQGDVFYTQVKYLKRVKAAKTGLVIPTQEKNLHVTVDPQRIHRLQQNSTY